MINELDPLAPVFSPKKPLLDAKQYKESEISNVIKEKLQKENLEFVFNLTEEEIARFSIPEEGFSKEDPLESHSIKSLLYFCLTGKELSVEMHKPINTFSVSEIEFMKIEDLLMLSERFILENIKSDKIFKAISKAFIVHLEKSINYVKEDIKPDFLLSFLYYYSHFFPQEELKIIDLDLEYVDFVNDIRGWDDLGGRDRKVLFCSLVARRALSLIDQFSLDQIFTLVQDLYLLGVRDQELFNAIENRLSTDSTECGGESMVLFIDSCYRLGYAENVRLKTFIERYISENLHVFTPELFELSKKLNLTI